MSNHDKVVIVTGGGTGIGRATVLRFAREGYTVVASGRRLGKLDETVNAASGMPGKVVPVAGDVGIETDVRNIVSEAVALGTLTYVVNNAGVGWEYGVTVPGSMAAIRDTTPENWREVMRINLDSVYFMCHAALQHLKTGACIINISSAGGIRGMGDAHTYATTKAGMINLTRSIAKTYGPEGIRANVVAPGFTDTDMVKPVLDSDFNPFADDTARFTVTPLGRPGTPEEMAAAIYFMAVEGTYCNGAVLVCDGGSLA